MDLFSHRRKSEVWCVQWVCAAHSSFFTPTMTSWSSLCAEEHRHAGTGLSLWVPAKGNCNATTVQRHLRRKNRVRLWRSCVHKLLVILCILKVVSREQWKIIKSFPAGKQSMLAEIHQPYGSQKSKPHVPQVRNKSSSFGPDFLSLLQDWQVCLHQIDQHKDVFWQHVTDPSFIAWFPWRQTPCAHVGIGFSVGPVKAPLPPPPPTPPPPSHTPTPVLSLAYYPTVFTCFVLSLHLFVFLLHFFNACTLCEDLFRVIVCFRALCFHLSLVLIWHFFSLALINIATNMCTCILSLLSVCYTAG